MDTKKFNSFGEALRESRRNSKKSIDEITKAMGWKKAYLMDIELGRSSPPSKEKIIQLCNILGIEESINAFLELSVKDKNKLILNIPKENDYEYTRTAAMLAREWDNISIDKLKNIQKILEGGE